MASLQSDRWWPVAEAASLFPIPPFPGSDARTSVFPFGTDHPLAADELARCIAAIAQYRVGGTYWGAQPKLGSARIILARPRDQNQFRAMVECARKEDAGVTFWFPDVQTEREGSDLAPSSVIGDCDPWHLLASAREVWTDRHDDLALFAAIADVPQRLFDGTAQTPPPATQDAVDPLARLAELLAGSRFRDPFSGRDIMPSFLVATLGFWRTMIDANRAIGAIYGIAFWKQPSIAPLMWNGGKDVPFRSAVPSSTVHASAAWIARTSAAILHRLAGNGQPLFQIEDGFIRSVGLGADCVPPLSIVVDGQGAHYDAAVASGLETLLASADFSPEIVDRASRLRALIVDQGISKYGIGTQAAVRAGGDRRHVLVTGQVEDDQSVLKGGGGLTSNLELLRRVRAIEPEAFIVYRPHPDVDAGHRKGYINDDAVLAIADTIAREDAITSLIDSADHVHVLTSLAGFEALLRGKPVTTHGVPFYAGWGLTEDLGVVPARRGRRRSLDELVAAALLLYPRYLDPVTGLPCPPEVLIERIASGYAMQNGPLVFARRLFGRVSGFFRSSVPRRITLRRA